MGGRDLVYKYMGLVAKPVLDHKPHIFVNEISSPTPILIIDIFPLTYPNLKMAYHGRNM